MVVWEQSTFNAVTQTQTISIVLHKTPTQHSQVGRVNTSAINLTELKSFRISFDHRWKPKTDERRKETRVPREKPPMTRSKKAIY